MLQKIYNYIKYSGISFTITVNPFQWLYVPYFYFGDDIEWSSKDVNLIIRWLFIKIHVLVSDGSW